MARHHFTDQLEDRAGNLWSNAVGTLYSDAAATTLVTDAFAASSGGSAVTTVTTDAKGQWEIWFDAPQSFYVRWTDNGGAAYPAGAPTQTAPWTAFVSKRKSVFQNPADEAAEDAADETGGIGTWDAMQAITPADGAPWYATDQGVSYVGVDGVWTRTTGNAKDIWVTDYGWKCDNLTASAPGNVIAIRAAIDAARAPADPTASGTRNVFIPEAPLTRLAYIDEPINFESVSLRGVGGSWRPQFAWDPMVAISYHNPSYGEEALFIIDPPTPTGASLHNLYILGGNRAVDIIAAANVGIYNCHLKAETTAFDRNHALVVDTTFWINVDRTQCTILGSTGSRYPIGLYGTDGHAIGHAIAEAYFEDIQLINGNIYLEHQFEDPAGGTGENVRFTSVVSENGHDQALFTARNTGTEGAGLIGWQWENCQQADATFADPDQPVFDLDGGGLDNYVGWKLKGLFQNGYLVKAVDITSLTGWEIERLHNTQGAFHPDSDAGKIWGCKVGGAFGAGLSVRSDPTGASGLAAAAVWENSYQDVGFRVGRALTDTHARGMWQHDGNFWWGSGAADPDTNLYRSAANNLKTDDTLESATGMVAPVPTNSQTGTTYTLVLTDRDKVVEQSNASAITTTIPTNASVAFPVGSIIEIYQEGAGQITVAAAGGVTLRAPGGAKTRVQYSSVSLRKRATNEWVLSGDTTT